MGFAGNASEVGDCVFERGSWLGGLVAGSARERR